MTKYTVLTGFNAPDPGGKRDANGRPVELRFDVGAILDEGDISPKALATLVQQSVLQPADWAGVLRVPVDATPTTAEGTPGEPKAATRGKKSPNS